jgi:hypothetical protein
MSKYNDKEIYPIKMSTAEIEEIIHGHKTGVIYPVRSGVANKYMSSGKIKDGKVVFTWFEGLFDVLRLPYAHGDAGEYLWVKEDVRLVDDTGNNKWAMTMYLQYRDGFVGDHALAVDPEYYIGEYSRNYKDGWIPAESMPYLYCRLRLEIKRVRVVKALELVDADFYALGLVKPDWINKYAKTNPFMIVLDFS